MIHVLPPKLNAFFYVGVCCQGSQVESGLIEFLICETLDNFMFSVCWIATSFFVLVVFSATVGCCCDVFGLSRTFNLSRLLGLFPNEV